LKPPGQAANLANAHFQRLFTIKQGEQFQISLKDEPEIQAMEQTYQELLTIIKKEVGLFSAKYKIYEVATNLWTNKAHIDVSDMKDAISLLTERLNLLNEEVKEQAKALQQLDSNFALNIPEPSSLQEQEKQLKTEVQRLQTELDNLTDNAKEKLQSKNLFNKEKITREREKLLQKYLTNPTGLTESEQQLLKQKLSKELLNKLITTQQQLLAKQTELREQFQQTLATTEQIQSLM
jgi:DNA repair exonuclease SbcCD ATPase subunit